MATDILGIPFSISSVDTYPACPARPSVVLSAYRIPENHPLKTDGNTWHAILLNGTAPPEWMHVIQGETSESICEKIKAHRDQIGRIDICVCKASRFWAGWFPQGEHHTALVSYVPVSEDDSA